MIDDTTSVDTVFDVIGAGPAGENVADRLDRRPVNTRGVVNRSGGDTWCHQPGEDRPPGRRG